MNDKPGSLEGDLRVIPPAAVSAEQVTGDVRLAVPLDAASRGVEQRTWGQRRDLVRRLHDGAALRLSALTLRLGLIQHRAAATDADLGESIDAVQEELGAVLQELREVTGRIYPPLLDQAGLGPAIQELAEKLCIPVRVRSGATRFDPAAEGAAYFAVAECLERIDDRACATGSEPTPIDVHIDRDCCATSDRADPAPLLVRLSGVDVHHATGMLDAVNRLGGTVERTRAPGIGTITARIPCG